MFFLRKKSKNLPENDPLRETPLKLSKDFRFLLDSFAFVLGEPYFEKENIDDEEEESSSFIPKLDNGKSKVFNTELSCIYNDIYSLTVQNAKLFFNKSFSSELNIVLELYNVKFRICKSSVENIKDIQVMPNSIFFIINDTRFLIEFPKTNRTL